MTTEWDDLSELVQARTIASESDNLMLVDGVNIAFRYLHRHNYKNFTDDYIRTITSLGKSYEAKRIICCFDAGASVYRKSIFPGYKGNREEKKAERTEEEQERFTAFFECLTETVDALPFEHYKFKGIEADDLIAYFVKHISDNYSNTWIISSDRDFYQLITDKVSIFSLASRKEITLDSLYETTGLTPKEYMVSRIIEGDEGDGIKGVMGIGPKRSQSLVKKYRTLDNLLDSLPIKGKAQYVKNLNESKEKLILNEKLINLHDYLEDIIDFSDNSETVKNVLAKALSN